MSILTAFSQMLIFFSLIMVGVACSRKNLVNEENAHSISKLIVNVFNPAIIFSSVLGNSQNKEGNFISLIVLIAIIIKIKGIETPSIKPVGNRWTALYNQ